MMEAICHIVSHLMEKPFIKHSDRILCSYGTGSYQYSYKLACNSITYDSGLKTTADMAYILPVKIVFWQFLALNSGPHHCKAGALGN
jgi:hypothetical protein